MLIGSKVSVSVSSPAKSRPTQTGSCPVTTRKVLKQRTVVIISASVTHLVCIAS